MIFDQILAQLNDLPTTFRRTGLAYGQLTDALANGLDGYTEAADATFAQIDTFDNAVWGWLDVWGLLLNIPRYDNESDILYKPRIRNTLLAWVGTLPALQMWGLLFFGQPVQVNERLPNFGYDIIVPPGVPLENIQQFIASIKRIRPAGIPFTVAEQVGSLYLDTINYFDDGEVVGDYLDDGAKNIDLGNGVITGNALPLLPDIYFNDPTMNPVNT